MRFIGNSADLAAVTPSLAFRPFQVQCSCGASLEVDSEDDIRYGSRYIGYGDDWSFFLYAVCSECDALIQLESYSDPGDPAKTSINNKRVSIPDALRSSAHKTWVKELYEHSDDALASWKRFLNHPDIRGWAKANPVEVADMKKIAIPNLVPVENEANLAVVRYTIELTSHQDSLLIAIDTIKELANQQAMPDDSHKKTLMWLEHKLDLRRRLLKGQTDE